MSQLYPRQPEILSLAPIRTSQTILEILTALAGCRSRSQSTMRVACCAGDVVAR